MCGSHNDNAIFSAILHINTLYMDRLLFIFVHRDVHFILGVILAVKEVKGQY